MSIRHRVPVLVAAASTAALLLAGCSSSGTIGEDSSGHKGSSRSSGGSSAGLLGGGSGGGDVDASDSTSGGSSGGSDSGAAGDPGCAPAMTAVENAQQYQHSKDPQSALTGLQTAGGQLHDAAGKAKDPNVKKAIIKVADDLTAIQGQVQNGKAPDTSKALSDARTLVELCGG